MTGNSSGSLPFESPEQENIRLRVENAHPRRLLAVHGIPIPQLAPDNPPPNKTIETAPPVGKVERARTRIALFRSVFRGREDVYARRWENDDGRHGYMPVIVKDWKAISRSRPEERKKVDQKTRKFILLTDAVIENHLLGKETVGGHIWIFFDRALPAITARKLACVLLTRTMERRHQAGLDSYDRFFPNQDTMPKGGLGNLIALPLQFAPRNVGNSAFIDYR